MDLEVDNMNVEFKSNVCQENVVECLSLSFTKFLNGNTATSDVTIVCHDGRIPAHKLVVASISPMLYNSMKNVEQEERIWIFIPDFSVQELKQYLQCVYSLQENKQCTELKRTLGVVPCIDSVPKEEEDPSYPVPLNNESKGKDNISKQLSKIMKISDMEILVLNHSIEKSSGETQVSDEDDKIAETDSNLAINTLKKVTCHICGEQFALKSNKNRHIRRKHPEEAEKLFSNLNCQYCGELIANINTMKLHVGRKHPKEIENSDILIPKKRSNWENSKDPFLYQYFAHDPDKSRYSCNICQTNILEEPYFIKMKMRDHLKDKHNIVKEIIKNYVCSHCGKSFEKDLYKTICENRHITGKTNFCEICGKGFYNTSLLGKHRRTHTGETPYQCDVCPKKFKWKSHLKSHMRVHTGETPFECKNCLRKFKFYAIRNSHKCTGRPDNDNANEL